MGDQPRASTSVRSLIVVATLIAVACSSPVPPSPSPSTAAPTAGPSTAAAGSPSPTPALTPPPKVVGDLELEECDPEGLLPCEHQAVVLFEPIAATGLSLTYSTEWADARTDRPTWNADALGLGGWALDVLQRYDPEHGILLSGDGSWRLAEAADIGSGQRAVPTFDGLRYFVFDDAWRHVRTVDSITGTNLLSISYDDGGRVAQVNGQLSGNTVELTVERSESGLHALVGIGATRTGTTTVSDGRLTAISRPDGTILFMSFAGFGLINDIRTTGRGAVEFEYDEAGRLASATDADGVRRTLAFEAASNGAVVVTASDALGRNQVFRAERLDDSLRRTFTDADATVTELVTAGDGSTTFAEPDGTVTVAGAEAHPRWGMAAPMVTPVVETRPEGTQYTLATTTTMGTGSPEPGGGAWHAERMVDGQLYQDSYDPATRTLTTTDPVGRETAQVLDDHARVLEYREPGSPALAFAYDDDGRLTSITEGTATTSYAYDPEKGEVIETRPDGVVVRSSYSGYANLVRTASDSENVTFIPGPAGKVAQVRPGIHAPTSIGYSDAGRETGYIPPAVEDDSTYEATDYNEAGQVATINGPGDRRIEIAYDSAGRIGSWTFDRGTSTASYGAQNGLLESNLSPDGVTTSFAFDGWVPVGIEWSGPVTGAVARTVDGQHRSTSEMVNGSDAIEFGYDEAGLMTSIDALSIERDPRTGLPVRALNGAIETTYEYDQNGRLAATTTRAEGDVVLSLRYSRDQVGRVIGIDRTDADGDVVSSSYTFDLSGRLSGVDGALGQESYAYDDSGNRTSASSDGDPGELATYDDRDRLITSPTAAYRYSPDGALVEREDDEGVTAYDFDDLGALRSVSMPDGTRTEYVIDAGGRRVGRIVDGVLTDGFLYNVDDQIVAWTDGSGEVVARFAYDLSGRLALVIRAGKRLAVVTDQVGSPIALLDSATGKLVNEVTYDAWGMVVSETQPGLIPLGFAGGLADPITGLVHFGAREYDPTIGRSTAPDPLRYAGGDINLYRYASGDPVNVVDPTGLRGRGVGGGGVGAGSGLGGGRAGGTGAGSRSSPYHDKGPAGGGGGKQSAPPNRPVSPGTGGTNKNGWYPNQGGPGGDPARPPSAGPTVGVCFLVVCANQNNDGFQPPTKTAPGGQCTGFCIPIVPGGGVCILACIPGGPGNYAICVLACVYGDPHLVTADGVRVGFQAAGEFVAAKSPDGTLEIQGRFEPVNGRTTVTLTTALALRLGTDRVAFYVDPNRPLIVNDQVIERAEYSATLSSGAIVERHGSLALVTWADGSQLAVTFYGRWMNYGFRPADEIAAGLVGIFGSHDGDPTDDLTTRDGQVIDPEAADFHELLYGQFAESWRLSQEESLFDYLSGQTTDTFTNRAIPTEPVTVAGLDPAERTNAEAACRAVGVSLEAILEDCIIDVALTGVRAYAGSAAAVQAEQVLGAAAGADPGTAIDLDQIVGGQLSAGLVDRYHFTAQAGDIVYVDAGEACDLALDWRLLRPDGVLTTFQAGCTDIGRRVLDTAGEWKLEVYSDDQLGGAYSFRVIPAPQPRQQTIKLGESASGSTTAVGEWHLYTLDAVAGQVVYLDAEGACDSGDLWWRLLRPVGVLSTFARACNDLGRRVLDESGAWVIEIYSDDLDTGSYAFRLVDVPLARETTTSVGATVSDSTSRVGEWHRYRLTATAGQIVYFDALGECVDRQYWRLLNPAGVMNTFAASCDDIGRRVLAEAGDWTIEVYSDELVTGAYSFRVIGAPPVKTGTIDLGQNVSDNIATIGEWHRWTFPAQAGQRIVIDTQGECVPDLWWRLLRPDGVLSTFTSTCIDSDVRTLDVAGDWVIEIYSDGMATGAYSLTVNPAP